MTAYLTGISHDQKVWDLNLRAQDEFTKDDGSSFVGCMLLTAAFAKNLTNIVTYLGHYEGVSNDLDPDFTNKDIAFKGMNMGVVALSRTCTNFGNAGRSVITTIAQIVAACTVPFACIPNRLNYFSVRSLCVYTSCIPADGPDINPALHAAYAARAPAAGYVTEEEAQRRETARDGLITEEEAVRRETAARDGLITEEEAVRRETAARDGLITEEEAVRRETAARDGLITEEEAVRRETAAKAGLITEEEAVRRETAAKAGLITEEEAVRRETAAKAGLITEEEAVRRETAAKAGLFTEADVQERIEAATRDFQQRVEQLEKAAAQSSGDSTDGVD